MRALERTDGVREAVPGRSGVTVCYDPSRVSAEAIAEAVSRTGYRARLAPARR